MHYIPLNASGRFIGGSHVRTEPERPRKKNDTAGNCIEDLMGHLATMYQDELINFSEKKYAEYERQIRKAVMRTKIENYLTISESKNLYDMIINVSVVIKDFLPDMYLEKIQIDVEKEIKKMGVTK